MHVATLNSTSFLYDTTILVLSIVEYLLLYCSTNNFEIPKLGVILNHDDGIATSR